MSQEERDHMMNNFKGEFAKVKDKVVPVKFIGNLPREGIFDDRGGWERFHAVNLQRHAVCQYHLQVN
jgi:hypothetical protein